MTAIIERIYNMVIQRKIPLIKDNDIRKTGGILKPPESCKSTFICAHRRMITTNSIPQRDLFDRVVTTSESAIDPRTVATVPAERLIERAEILIYILIILNNIDEFTTSPYKPVSGKLTPHIFAMTPWWGE